MLGRSVASPLRRGALVSCPAVVLGFAFVLGSTAVNAAKNDYSYETNPVRLGQKALEEGKVPEAKAFFEEAIANEWELGGARTGLAEVYVHLGNPSEAEPTFRQAIKDGNSPEAHAGLGILLVHLGRVEEGEVEINEALKLKNDLWPAQFGKALVAIHKGQFGDAKSLLEKGKKKKEGLKDGEDKYHYGMAKLLLAQGDTKAAESEALLAMTQNTTNPAYTTLVADIYVKADSPALAVQTYEAALAKNASPPTAPFYHQLGGLYEKMEEGNEALKRYQEAVKIDSTFAPALRDMGRLYTMGKAYDKAYLAYSRYVQTNPDDTESLLNFVKAALEVKQNKSAHEAVKRVFAKDSTQVETRLLYARAAYLDKDKERATQLYSSVPDSSLQAVDFVRQGQIAFENQKWDEAKAKLERGLGLDSTSVEGYFTLGLVEMRRNNAAGAIDPLKKATELAPSFVQAPLNLGIAYLSAKRAPEGIATLRQAQTLAPENPQVLISLAQALVSADSVSAAITEYRKVIEVDSTNVKAYRGLGLCQIQKKSYGEAVTALKQATTMDAGNADGWAWLGQAYLGLNDVLRARQAAEKAVAINSNHSTGKSVLDVAKRAQGAGSSQ